LGEWVLKVELSGEWEECKFASRKEALAAFIALTTDYRIRLRRAILFASAAGVHPFLSKDKVDSTDRRFPN
jgi:hypothetical protein